MHANRFTVVLDANVLIPVLTRDVLLSLAEQNLYRVRWNALILDEVRQNLPRANPSVTEDAASRAVSAMVRAFPDALIEGWERLADGLSDLPDPDDAHVIASAVNTGATVIVSQNLRHFPSGVLDPLGIACLHPDDFIADTISLDPGSAVVAIDRMLARHRKEPKSYADLIRAMEAMRFPRSVEELIASLP
ncbi:MAG: PIN domain-containing protein [Pseudomonadota bacterium]